ESIQKSDAHTHGFRPRGFKDCVSRDIPAALETRSPPDRSRTSNGVSASGRRAMGALEVTATVSHFSLGSKSLRPKCGSVNPKPSPKHFVKLRRNRLKMAFRSFPARQT